MKFKIFSGIILSLCLFFVFKFVFDNYSFSSREGKVIVRNSFVKHSKEQDKKLFGNIKISIFRNVFDPEEKRYESMNIPKRNVFQRISCNNGFVNIISYCKDNAFDYHRPRFFYIITDEKCDQNIDRIYVKDDDLKINRRYIIIDHDLQCSRNAVEYFERKY